MQREKNETLVSFLCYDTNQKFIDYISCHKEIICIKFTKGLRVKNLDLDKLFFWKFFIINSHEETVVQLDWYNSLSKLSASFSTSLRKKNFVMFPKVCGLFKKTFNEEL